MSKRDKIRELRQQGYSLGWIAQAMGCSRTNVNAYCRDIPPKSHAGLRTDLRARSMPKAIPELIAELDAQGGNVAALARKYGIRRHSLWTAIKRYRDAHEGVGNDRG
jgi:biotin operon repressor